MIASFSSFRGQGVSQPWDQTQAGIRTLKQIDGKPGDKNTAPDAISMKTSQGQLDAVVLTNPDQSTTVIQRLSKTSGEVQTSWLEVPRGGNGIPNLSGFEVTVFNNQLSGQTLEVKETYSANSLGIPTRTYWTNGMRSTQEISNALMRAESVLAAYTA